MMNLSDFTKHLETYGPDLEIWPGSLREEAKKSVASSVKLQKLLEEEQILVEALNLREFEQPSSNLASRIINASRQNSSERKQQASFIDYLNTIFSSFHLPKPAFALSMILVIGITVGFFGNSPDNDVINSEDLQASEINFYDGDFYE